MLRRISLPSLRVDKCGPKRAQKMFTTETTPKPTKAKPLSEMDTKQQREILDAASKDFGVQNMEDWYHVSRSTLRCHPTVAKIHNFYNNSTSKMITTIYPEHPWNLRQFAALPRFMWKDKSNHRLFLDEMGKSLGLTKLEDWYNVTTVEADEMGASGLLTKFYRHSLIEALLQNYPEHTWHPWLFKKIAQGWWKMVENQRQFLDWATVKLEIRTLEDWYTKSPNDLIGLGGRVLVRNYKNSLPVMLETIYNDHKWHHWKFATSSKGLLREQLLVQMSQIGAELGVKTLDDWYSISTLEFESVAGRLFARNKRGTLLKLLEETYPEHTWDKHRLIKKTFVDG